MESHCEQNKLTTGTAFINRRKVAALLFVGLVGVVALSTIDRATASENPVSDAPSAQQLQTFLKAPDTVYNNPARYRIYRNRKPVGMHTLSFEYDDKELTVDVESEIVIKRLGLTFYSRRYTAQEVWSGGELVLLLTVVDESNQPTRTIEGTSRGDYFVVNDSTNVSEFTAPLPEHSSNHWHPGAVFTRRIFHVLHGRLYQGTTVAKGWERVVLESGEVVSARRFNYSAGFNASVWYDADWRWVKLAFVADDGSTIEYKCLDCRG